MEKSQKEILNLSATHIVVQVRSGAECCFTKNFIMSDSGGTR